MQAASGSALSSAARDELSQHDPKASPHDFRGLLDALPAAIYTTDTDGRITFYNKAAVVLWGREPEIGSSLWCGSWRLYYPDGRPMPHDECPMAIALKEKRVVRGLEGVAERPDGSRVPFQPYPTPLYDRSGKMVGAINMLVDITHRKQAEQQQKGLLDELNHRVKNTLATVQSLANQTIRGAGVPNMMRHDFQARLMALSKAHDQLTRAGWRNADLRQIVHDILEPYQGTRANQIELAGAPVRLMAQAALTLSMILHELATNAVKYGALSTPGGHLRLSWEVVPERSLLQIRWQETGGPAVREPAHRGFGSRLLDRGTQSLKGSAQLSFDPDGLQCSMEVPLHSVLAW